MTPLAARFRETFLAAVSADAGRPICLSGGVDSATILAASLALGQRPLCVSFRLGEQENADTAVARSMTAAFGLEHVVVSVRSDPAGVVEDCRRAIDVTGVTTKTHVQCSIPFLYMGEELVRRGEREALFGMAADDLWGSGRKGGVAASQGRAAFDALRAKNIADAGQSDWSVVKAAASTGLRLIDPWRSPELIAFMLARSIADLTKPRPKFLALYAFEEFWRRGAWYRPNASLQVVSGIRERHDEVLLDPSVNGRGAQAVLGVYNDLKR